MTPPLRRQYLEIKRRYPDMLVLFQIGDFFEAFDDDAILLSRALGVTLTTKQLGKKLRVPLAGIPVHSLHHHLGKLVAQDHKVAICEQLTPPGKKLIKREVTRVVTPGTARRKSEQLSRRLCHRGRTSRHRLCGCYHH
jgi:DNA mismatch repair protein MutS